jgi:S1-C subfamily serine protease
VIVESLPPEEFPGEEGVIVRKLQPGSPADRGGLRIDDVILEINRKAIRGIGEFNRFVQQLRQEQSVLLLVRREKGIFFIPIKP